MCQWHLTIEGKSKITMYIKGSSLPRADTGDTEPEDQAETQYLVGGAVPVDEASSGSPSSPEHSNVNKGGFAYTHLIPVAGETAREIPLLNLTRVQSSPGEKPKKKKKKKKQIESDVV